MFFMMLLSDLGTYFEDKLKRLRAEEEASDNATQTKKFLNHFHTSNECVHYQCQLVMILCRM